MRRNFDQSRQLLLTIWDYPEWLYPCVTSDSSTDEQRAEYFHLRALCDQGFLEERGRFGGMFRMTATGHDFCEHLSEDGRWEAAKRLAKRAGVRTLRDLWEATYAAILAEMKRNLGLD